MKKHKLILIGAIILLFLFLTSCTTPGTKLLDANFIITEWTQEYYEYFQEWSDYVYIYYEVENTGSIEIDYYKVYFTITCLDGSKFYDWTNGLSVGVGHKYSDYTLTNVGGKKATSVVITDYEIKNYDWY
jgi:hypothetical protein